LVAAAKFLVAATKILFVVPHFAAVNKTIFFRGLLAKKHRAYSVRVFDVKSKSICNLNKPQTNDVRN